MNLSKSDVEKIIMEHLAKNNPHNLKHTRLEWKTRGGDDGYGGWESPDISGLTVYVELELK